jgi:hypothetical protein
MEQKYAGPDQIPDEAIRQEFANADVVQFSAKPVNLIQYRQITFGDLGFWLPLTRVLPLLGITPQILRPVFNPQHRVIKLQLPLEDEFYDPEELYQEAAVELPENIEDYEQLGSFPLHYGPFAILAEILGKSVEVWQEDGNTGSHSYQFTASPSRRITWIRH